MEERLRKKAQSDEDEDYMFLMSILISIKELDVIQRLELRMDFLARKLQISKNLSLPSNGFHTMSLISCHPTPFLHSATHFPDSDPSVLPSCMSFILSAHLLLFKLKSENVERGIPTLDEEKCLLLSFYILIFLEIFQAEILI